MDSSSCFCRRVCGNDLESSKQGHTFHKTLLKLSNTESTNYQRVLLWHRNGLKRTSFHNLVFWGVCFERFGFLRQTRWRVVDWRRSALKWSFCTTSCPTCLFLRVRVCVYMCECVCVCVWECGWGWDCEVRVRVKLYFVNVWGYKKKGSKEKKVNVVLKPGHKKANKV